MKVTEQIAKSIIVYAANFEVLKMNRVGKLRSDGVLIKVQNTTMFEPVIMHSVIRRCIL